MHETTKVLLIEDNPGDARLIQEMLKEDHDHHFKLKTVEMLDKGLKYLKEDNFDVLLLDLALPDSFGLDTFFKARETVPKIPIIILSVFGNEDDAIRAVREGAQDYLVKGHVDRELLSRSIYYAIERKSIEEELIEHRENLEELVEERTAELRYANEELQKEIKVRKRAEKEAKASLEEKEILLEEIHGRILHNLGIISSLAGIETSKIMEKDPLELHQEIQNRVKAIALVHEKMSKSEDFAVINMKDYIKDLVNYLGDQYEVNADFIKIQVNVNDVLLDVDDAIPVGLIITEMVSNSIKYAFPDKKSGEIGVKFRFDHGMIKLDVMDNGIGLPDNIDIGNPETMGLKLVNMLLRQSDGEIKFKKDKGTGFRVEFREF